MEKISNFVFPTHYGVVATERQLKEVKIQQNCKFFGKILKKFYVSWAGTPKRQTDYGLVKNVDKTLCWSSVAARKCPLCHKQYKRMVNHFRNFHTQYEVFVSRLSEKMATKLKQSPLFTTKYTRASGMQHLRMICPFCECEKDFFVPYWSNHIRTHTGEYTNECILCSKVSLNASHCGQPTMKQKCNLLSDGLSAYVCNRCNWTQIDGNRVIEHIKTQHGVNNARENVDYQKITIIRALNQVNAQINPHNVLVQGIHLIFDFRKIMD